jgi:hypothetical protein
MSDRISALAVRIVATSHKLGLVIPNYSASYDTISKFLKQHPEIAELLSWETGEKMIDNRDGYCEEVNQRRSKSEQVAFVISKLEDPATFALAQEYCQLVSSAINAFQPHC